MVGGVPKKRGDLREDMKHVKKGSSDQFGILFFIKGLIDLHLIIVHTDQYQNQFKGEKSNIYWTIDLFRVLKIVYKFYK